VAKPLIVGLGAWLPEADDTFCENDIAKLEHRRHFEYHEIVAEVSVR